MRRCGVVLEGPAPGRCHYQSFDGPCFYHESLEAGLLQDSFGRWWGEPWRPPPISVLERNGEGPVWRPAAVDVFQELLRRQEGRSDGPWL